MLALCGAAEAEKMKINVGKTEYTVTLDKNSTAQDIAANLPLKNITMKRFGGHEFYHSLSFTPRFASETTSSILAGHVYYWDGWNALVINYIDWDIAPYKVVHVGEITDKSICKELENSSDEIRATFSR